MSADMTDGYSTTQAAALTGATFRQLDYWSRTGLATPSYAVATGSGHRRRWSETDLDKVRFILNLIDVGICRDVIRDLIEDLDRGGVTWSALEVVIEGGRLVARERALR